MSEIVLQFSRAAPVEFFDKYIKDRSLCICRVTRSPFSHVDLVIGDDIDTRFPKGSLLGSSNNPKAPVIIGNPCGVAIRHMDYQEFAVRRIARISCSDEQRLAFTKYCIDQLGKPFDTSALRPKEMFNYDWRSRDWRDERRWFCAELMARAAEKSKLMPWKIIGYKAKISACDLLWMLNPLIDVDAFWEPIPGLMLGTYEKKEIL